jgi:hypothetical protein
LIGGSTFNGIGQGDIISGYQIDYGSTAITLTAVPEPGTLGLLGVALGGFFFRRLRKRRHKRNVAGAAGKQALRKLLRQQEPAEAPKLPRQH